MTRRAKKRGRRRAGFTLIEVMMAIGIMTVGSVGIMALQEATIRGNMEAREMTEATTITQTWIERLRRDALLWNAIGSSALSTTTYLKTVNSSADTWFTPAATTATTSESYAFNWYGSDMVPSSGDEPTYCVNVRLSWASSTNDALRVDVRTWWHRQSVGTTAGTDENVYLDCGVGSEANITTALAAGKTLDSVEASTLVRWHQLP